jgi:hypothetical protein
LASLEVEPTGYLIQHLDNNKSAPQLFNSLTQLSSLSSRYKMANQDPNAEMEREVGEQTDRKDSDVSHDQLTSPNPLLNQFSNLIGSSRKSWQPTRSRSDASWTETSRKPWRLTILLSRMTR